MTASYSASLLEAWNLNLSAYSTSIPTGEVRIKPAPLPWALAAPSTNNLHMGRSDASWVVLVGSAELNSIKKYAKMCPLIVVLDLYLMSNSLNSIAHFTSLHRGFWFVQYLLHRVLCWNFDSVGLEVRPKSSGGGYQC